jgi:hypothetical protein
MMNRFSKYIIAAFVIVSGLRAQDTKYGGAFLELGIGPRALALGSSYVALADDGSGFYWNPAGTAFLSSLNVSMMYANLFNSLENHGYVSVAMPVFGDAVISASWIRLAVEDIPRYYDPNLLKERDERYLDPDGSGLRSGASGSFTFANNAYFITFARVHHWKADLGWQYFELPIDFAYGFNFKLIDIGLDDKKGSGMGVDGGIRFSTGLNDLFADDNFGLLSVGVSIQDMFKTAITWDTDSKQKDEIEPAWRFGFAYNQPLLFIDSEFLFTYDIYTKYEGSWHLGNEFVYHKLLALRFGFYDGDFTAGAGISYWKLRVDYAYQSHDLGNSHRVGISFHF